LPTDPRQPLLEIFLAAIAAVGGRARVAAHLRSRPPAAPVYLIALGKAACAMAQGAHDALGEKIRDGFIVTKRGAAEPLPWPVLAAGHPLPDESSLEAGGKLIRFVQAIPQDAQVVVLLSGGASALVEALPDGIGLKEWQDLNRWLLASGLDIHAMNAVRKRLSRLKGGRLAQILHPRTVSCLALSDVPGDDPRSIGSGPLVADEAPVPDGLPAPVRAALARSSPLPAANDPCFQRVEFKIIATLADAKRAAADAARQFGYETKVHSEFIAGDAAETGARLANQLLESAAGVVHVWGGETTIKLPPRPGRGGRNQSLALSAARALQGRNNTWLLAAGTDGTDGPTDDAGALVDGDTVARGTVHGLKADNALAHADAGTFLEASGDLVHTGPTGTNVMDLILGLRT